MSCHMDSIIIPWNPHGIVEMIPYGIQVEWRSQNEWDLSQNIFHMKWWIPCGIRGKSKDLFYMHIKTTFQFIANPICLLFRPGTLLVFFILLILLFLSCSFFTPSSFITIYSLLFSHSLFMRLLSTTNFLLQISIKISK